MQLKIYCKPPSPSPLNKWSFAFRDEEKDYSQDDFNFLSPGWVRTYKEDDQEGRRARRQQRKTEEEFKQFYAEKVRSSLGHGNETRV